MGDRGGSTCTVSTCCITTCRYCTCTPPSPTQPVTLTLIPPPIYNPAWACFSPKNYSNLMDILAFLFSIFYFGCFLGNSISKVQVKIIN